MYIVPPGSTGRRRAILIGINYVGQQGQLSGTYVRMPNHYYFLIFPRNLNFKPFLFQGCHNDVANIKKYLINVQGFNESEMLILMDDNRHHSPTKRNIEDAFTRITQYSQAGDVVFIHYSGHGGRVRDVSGDEEDGFDSTLIPLDFKRAGQIIDDDILRDMVKPMRRGVNVTVLMDCCHSGTVLDLPYRFSADDNQMRLNQVSMNNILGKLDVGTAICCALVLFSLCDALNG